MDTVTSTDLLTTGTAPATAMGLTYLVMAQTTGLMMGNAITAQQGGQRLAEASVAVVTALVLKSAT